MATSSGPRGGGGAKGGFPIGLTLATLVGLVILVGLGLWQVKRLHWKEQLLARIAAVEAAPAEPLSVVLGQAADTARNRDLQLDYRRVLADCPNIETTPFLRLYAIKDAVAGYRIITACPLASGPYGAILVDRGFVSDDDASRVKVGAGHALTQPIEGVLRRGDARNFVTPENQPAADLWYWRDIPAMARTLGAARPAPTYLMLERPAPTSFGPTPAPVPTDIPNNHLQYAVTWFGLAVSLAGVYLAMLWRRRSH